MPAAGNAPSGAAVVLIHGFWLNPAWMAPLGRRLARRGLVPWHLSYATMRRDLDEAAARLARCVQALRRQDGDRVHLVGHSLGGLVALRALARGVDLGGGRVVLLGCPVRGSGVARHFRARRLGWIMGAMADHLAAGAGDWPCGDAAVGVVAGTLDFGIGRLLGGYRPPGDGTVALAETRLGRAADTIEVRTTHLGLLFSLRAAEAVAAFLAHGRFAGRPAAP